MIECKKAVEITNPSYRSVNGSFFDFAITTLLQKDAEEGPVLFDFSYS